MATVADKVIDKSVPMSDSDRRFVIDALMLAEASMKRKLNSSPHDVEFRAVVEARLGKIQTLIARFRTYNPEQVGLKL